MKNYAPLKNLCESGNPGKNWIPGQAWNDKHDKVYVVMYKKGSTVKIKTNFYMDLDLLSRGKREQQEAVLGLKPRVKKA